jgi:surface antigen
VLLALLAPLALAACQNGTMVRLGPLPQAGLLFDQPPPPVTVVRDGPAGELLTGGVPPMVPAAEVDEVVAQGLRPWLTEIEMRQLALASQRAVAQYPLVPVLWQAFDPSGTRTARGTVVPIGNVFLAVRGFVCRDVRQTVVKDGAAHGDQVTLCRRHFPGDLAVWVVGRANQ